MTVDCVSPQCSQCHEACSKRAAAVESQHLLTGMT